MNDPILADPQPAKVITPERAKAIEQAINDGKARSNAHADFLAKAGTLILPE